MKRLYLQHFILSSTLIFALGACVHKPSKTMKAVATPKAPPQPTQQTVLLQEARIESENLRSELARLKILMAKQNGELQALRHQSQSVQNRERDQGLQLQDIRSQLLSSQAERDQLRKQNTVLEGQVASMPNTSQLASDIKSLHGVFQKIRASLKELATDITLIKQEMRLTPKKLQPQQTKLTKTQPSTAKTASQTPDHKGRIIIQDGDTLWQLSRTYQVSVEQLKEWNNMSSDVIMTGLHLIVTKPMETVQAPPSNKVPAMTEVPEPYRSEESFTIPIQETPQPTVETHVEVPSEPTHILSIGSPESDSHESP